MSSAISGPIPPYQNLPINANFYKPSRFVISGVSLGLTTTITTSVNHNYVIGQQCRLLIPPKYGCVQLNEKNGFVISIPALNQVVLNINSINSNAYIASSAPTQAQILAIGDINTGHINPFGRFHTFTDIPGSFINISPL